MLVASYIYIGQFAPKDTTQLWVEPKGGGEVSLHVFSDGGWKIVGGGDGKSAYELAVEKGYSGTLDEWLDSLQGKSFTYDDLTSAQKAELAQDAVAAANRAAQAVETIEAAINGLDPSQSAEDAVVALAARQGVLEGDIAALGPNNVYNFYAHGTSSAMSLANAVQLIPSSKYSLGLHIIFNLTDVGVVEYQFVGSAVSLILEENYWKQVLLSPWRKTTIDILEHLPSAISSYINSTGLWAQRRGQSSYIIDLSDLDGYTLTVNPIASGDYPSRIAFLTSDSHNDGDAAALDASMNTMTISLEAGSDAVSYIIPPTSKYLWVNGGYSGISFLPSAIFVSRIENEAYVLKRELDSASEESANNIINKIAVFNESSLQRSDLDIVDEQNHVLVRFAGGHIETKNFNSANIIAHVSAKYREPLATFPTDVTKPQHIGQINVQRKVELLCGLVWTPLRPMPSTSLGFESNGLEDTNVVSGRIYFSPNVQITGIPYSSTGINGRAIGCDITIETYMTALKNPNSVLYTLDLRNTLTGNLVGPYYGSNCSSFTNYIQGIYAICKGRNNNYAANRILRSPKNADALQIGDVIYMQKTTIDSGHAVIVYRIDKDENGYITRIYEAEEDSKKANTYNYTKAQFENRFFKGGYGYVYGDTYRNVDLVDNEYVEEFDDSTYAYSEAVGLNLGNNTNYDKADDMPIEVTMLSSVGFSVILGSTTIATYSASDGVAGWGSTRIVTLDKSSLAVGTYEIRPTSGTSQYFHLCDSGSASATWDSNRNLTITASGYSGNVTPYAVLFVSSRVSQTTRGLYLMDGASVTIPKDWLDFINTTNDIAYASVIYRNEYGNIYTELITI